jgi:hypothetical protein
MTVDREGIIMVMLNFIFKLLKHGGIFLLRVVGILAPAAGSLSSPVGKARQSMADFRHASFTGHFPDGTPERWEYKNIYVEDDDK